MRASEPSTADDTGLKEQAVTRRAFVSFGRLSDGQPGKCTESSSGHLGDFTERPFVCREPALLAGRRKVTSFPKPGRHPTGGTVRHAADVARFPSPSDLHPWATTVAVRNRTRRRAVPTNTSS